MGYRIEYGPVKKVRGMEKRISRKAALTGLCFLLFCILVGVFWPERVETLRNLLIPGDPAVTAAAMEELTAELQAGRDLTDSLMNFCLTVLEGAEFAAVR